MITAKARPISSRPGFRKPDDVLLLSVREERRKGDVGTSRGEIGHAGYRSALSIIGAVEGRKPALADHATDDLKFVNLIKEILRDLVRAASDVARVIIIHSNASG